MEIWKTIKNFERYEVSNLGNVRSKDTDTEAANKTNLNRSSISHCVNGKQNKTKDGSKWSKIKGQTTIENTF